jgi:hypothetical protein
MMTLIREFGDSSSAWPRRLVFADRLGLVILRSDHRTGVWQATAYRPVFVVNQADARPILVGGDDDGDPSGV